MLAFVAAVVAASACDGFFVDVAAAPDEPSRYTPPASCTEAVERGEADIDADVRALPEPAQRKAACLLGTPALDDLRRAAVHDAQSPVMWRARCVVALLPREPVVVDGLAFLVDADRGRPRVSPIVAAAASWAATLPSAARAPAEAALVPVLERALVDRALDRWALGDTLCAPTSTTAHAPVCAAHAADRARAESRVLAQVAGVGGTASAALGVGAAALYLVPAFVLADTIVALPMGALGGAFFGAVVGGALGVVAGLPFAAEPPADRLRPGDLGVITLPIAMAADVVNAGVVVFATAAAGVVVGVALGVVGGGLAAAQPGVPRTLTFAAGGVGLATAVVAVGLGVTWVVAAEADPAE